MSDALLVRHCSPTLAGLKTGSMFACPCRSREEVLRWVRSRNRMLRARGLCLLPLRFSPSGVLLYLYRPVRLTADLARADAEALLRERGYDIAAPAAFLAELMRRLRSAGEFPHEIGLFLGYPPEDVRGFIENRAKGFRQAGPWKVYGDAEAARKLFAKYRKCTGIYEKQLSLGSSLERLAVPGP